MPIKLTIVDDHPLVVRGLKDLFLSISQIEVISTFTSGKDLLQGLKEKQPDVLLLDLQMPGLSGTALVDVIRRDYRDIRILMLTGTGSAVNAQYLLKQGCMGFLLKSTTEEETLMEAIERVYNGKIFIDPGTKEELIENMLTQPDADIESITSREKEVLKLVVAGYTSQEIADKLIISISTINSHRHNLLQKLNVTNTAGLIKVATKLKLIDESK